MAIFTLNMLLYIVYIHFGNHGHSIYNVMLFY